MPRLTDDPKKLAEQAERWRETQRASAIRYAARVREEGGRKPLAKRSKKYAVKHAAQFAEQADLCRHLPCCACFPWLYMEDLSALEFVREDRISDPHHVETRRTADDSKTVPLCMGLNGHHAKCEAVGSSQRKVQDEAGVDFRAVAARLARYLDEGRAARDGCWEVDQQGLSQRDP